MESEEAPARKGQPVHPEDLVSSSTDDSSLSIAAELPASQQSPEPVHTKLLAEESDEAESIVMVSPQDSAQATSKTIQNDEVRTCWICQMDDTEDPVEGSEWRTPCPCSLTAHNECLLEWIANEETPKAGESPKKDIRCPQCKKKIDIRRPMDPIVTVVDLVQRGSRALILPTALSTVIGCTYSGMMVYGLNSLRLVFGVDEADRILTPGIWGIPVHTGLFGRTIGLLDPFFPAISSLSPPIANLKLLAGLPLIAPVLVLSRTQLADQTFSLLLPVYLLNYLAQTSTPPSTVLTHWPPSSGLTFATLPYLRSLYNYLYKISFSSLEKKWDLAVQRKPREGETAEQIAAEAQAQDMDAILQLEIAVEEDDAEEQRQLRDIAQQIADLNQLNNRLREQIGQVELGRAAPPPGEQPDLAPPQADEVNAQANGENLPLVEDPAPPAADPPEDPHAGHNHEHIHRNVPITTAHIASTVMGALFFPAISSIMGDILKYTLPTTLVAYRYSPELRKLTSSWGGVIPDRGLLKEKWGRTVVGGCLFVVLKDALTLYVKWQRARQFGKREVLDYKGKRRSDGA